MALDGGSWQCTERCGCCGSSRLHIPPRALSSGSPIRSLWDFRVASSRGRRLEGITFISAYTLRPRSKREVGGGHWL